MTFKTLLVLLTALALSLLILPGAAVAQDPGEHAAENVNARYPVEDVSLAGVGDSAISKSLRADMRRLVGQNYDQGAVNDLAFRLREELPGYTIDVRVTKGHEKEHLRITFEARKNRNKRFDVHVPPISYYSREGWSGAIDIAFDTHHNFFSFGIVSSIEDLVERNAGYWLRYEHRQVGTDKVWVGVEFAQYHPTIKPPTQAALAAMPGVPGPYRNRQNFAPSVSVLPVRALKLTFGLSLQNLDFDVPAPHSGNANAFTGDVQVRHRVDSESGWRQAIGADYSLRKTTTSLDSDFLYTRHFVSADYTISNRRHLFGFHGQLGHIDGAAPLFERFAVGNSYELRGWDKFEVAPAGGSRLAYGSLEYRYRPFQIFYDFGTVWDPGQTAVVRHSIGAGLAFKNGFFMSLAFPVRTHDVTPVFLFGVRAGFKQ